MCVCSDDFLCVCVRCGQLHTCRGVRRLVAPLAPAPAAPWHQPRVLLYKPLVRLSGSTASASAAGAAAAPHTRAVGVWLLGCAGLVAGTVVVGGLTRLTRAGLSMVEWKPHSVSPPTTHEAWLEEFEKYKQFPEYQRVNKGMTLEEFKVWRPRREVVRGCLPRVCVRVCVDMSTYAVRSLLPGASAL